MIRDNLSTVISRAPAVPRKFCLIESQIRISQKRSIIHPPAQRNACGPGERQQRRFFAQHELISKADS